MRVFVLLMALGLAFAVRASDEIAALGVYTRERVPSHLMFSQYFTRVTIDPREALSNVRVSVRLYSAAPVSGLPEGPEACSLTLGGLALESAGFEVSGDPERLELYFPSLEAGEELAFKVIWRDWLAYPYFVALNLQSDQGAARQHGMQVLDYVDLDYDWARRFLRQHRARGGLYTEAHKTELRRALRGGPYYALPLWVEGDASCWRGTTPVDGAGFKPEFLPSLEPITAAPPEARSPRI